MKEFLRQLKNEPFHGIDFYLNEDGYQEANAFYFNDLGIKDEGSPAGDMYDIIIMSNTQLTPPERFKGILISPLEYVSRMMDDGFTGVISVASTLSGQLMDDAYSNMKYMRLIEINEYEKVKKKC